jgi:hypothetical protein
MTIAVRATGGGTGTCSVCGALVVIDRTAGLGEIPCPMCGVLLWFLETFEGGRFHCWDEVPADFRERLRVLLTRHDDFLLRCDSLDLVEIALEIEDEFGVSIPEEELRKMRGVGDIIEYLFCRWQYRG